jgi:hypothetical protein
MLHICNITTAGCEALYQLPLRAAMVELAIDRMSA